MNWQELYKQKLTTPEKAVQNIKSGNNVVLAHAAGEPPSLVDAMVKNKESYTDVKIYQMVPLSKSEYAQPGMEKHFRLITPFTGGSTRAAVNENRGDYLPMSLS